MHPIVTFTRRVKDPGRLSRKDIDEQDTTRIAGVVAKLDSLPRVARLRFDELRLRTNATKWIRSLLADFPSVIDSNMEYLLSDLTDVMRTRMREESKYVLGLVAVDRVTIAHSIYGEETISPEWKTIPRMLDADNVLRFVSFCKMDNGALDVVFWEREATTSFCEWLGVRKKQGFLFGGRYRVICDIDDVVTELQLTEEEMEEWLRKHPEFRDGSVKLEKPLRILNIREIRTGSRRYECTGDFIQDFEAQKRGVANFRRQYDTLAASQLTLFSYYDERSCIVKQTGESQEVELQKEDSGFDVIFAHKSGQKTVLLRDSYLKDLAARLQNGTDVLLFHAGMPFCSQPPKFFNLHLYNELALPETVRGFFEHCCDAQGMDSCLELILKWTGLCLLFQANKRLPIGYVLEELARVIGLSIGMDGRITRLEGGPLEFKSREYLAGKDDKVVEEFVADMRTKLASAHCKVYLVGVEDNGRVKPISASRLRSDRVEGLRERIEAKVEGKLFALPLFSGDHALLVLFVVSDGHAPRSATTVKTPTSETYEPVAN